MNNTCKYCQERYVGCHSKCEKYIQWRKEKDKILEQKEKEQQAFPDLNRKAKKHIWKEMKK